MSTTFCPRRPTWLLLLKLDQRDQMSAKKRTEKKPRPSFVARLRGKK